MYLIYNDIFRPVLNIATATQSTKFYWNAQFAGAYFTQDKVRVQRYLAQQVISNTGWNLIKGYQSITNVQQTWLDIQTFYAKPAELHKKMTIAHAVLKLLKYRSKEISLFLPVPHK